MAKVFNPLVKKGFDETGSGSGGTISDDAYSGSWDGVTDTAPSQNAVYDAISAIGGSFDGAWYQLSLIDGLDTLEYVSGSYTAPSFSTNGLYTSAGVTGSASVRSVVYIQNLLSIDFSLIAGFSANIQWSPNHTTLTNSSVIGIGDWISGNAGTAINYTAKHIGFYADMISGGTCTVYASNGNGTTQTKTAIDTITPATSTNYVLKFLHDGTSIKFYADGELVATHTTNLPTGIPSRLWGWGGDKTVGTSARNLNTTVFLSDYAIDNNGAFSTGGNLNASIAETNTGTLTTKYVSPDGLAGSNLGTKSVSVLVNDATALTTGDGKAYFRIPSSMNGMDLVSANASRLSGTGVPSVQIYNLTQTADMLSTNITIDSGETDSSTATTAPVIDTGNDDVATGDRLRIDIDDAGTNTLWLEVQLEFRLP